MNTKTRNATLIAALAALCATAWAANELIEPAKDPIMAQVAASEASQAGMPPATPAPEPTDPAPPPSEPGLSPGPMSAQAAPVASQPEAVAQPPVIVEDRRMSLDERIQSQVIDRLASAQDVSGRIGVESSDAVVTLTGTVFSGSHVDRAGRYAREVQDVKSVQNELRPQMSKW